MLTYGLIKEDEMNAHPWKNLVTYYVGGNSLDNLEVNDLGLWHISVLCSDGAHDAMSKDHFKELMIKDNATEIANSCYLHGSLDNISVIRIERTNKDP